MTSVWPALATIVDGLHALAMLLWGLGLPLLLWHRHPRASRAYAWFAMTFVVVSVLSDWTLGECVLTALARALRERGGELSAHESFIVQLTNRIAGIRPSEHWAVRVWEAAIAVTSAGSLFFWSRRRRWRAFRPRGQTHAS